MIFNEIKCNVNTSLSLMGGMQGMHLRLFMQSVGSKRSCAVTNVMKGKNNLIIHIDL